MKYAAYVENCDWQTGPEGESEAHTGWRFNCI